MASRYFIRFVENQMGRFPHMVLCLVLELVLITILFLDGFLAFFANEFAKHFNLKIPCWLCTRMNHVLAFKTPDFYYNDSICDTHKKHISASGFCHNNKKLSEIRKMCESCLLSFAAEKEAQLSTYKSLMGILNKDMECFVEEGQKVRLSFKDDKLMQVDKNTTESCFCSYCGVPLKVKSSSSKGKNSQLKFMPEADSEIPQNEDGNNAKYHNIKSREEAKGLPLPLLTEAGDLTNEPPKTPTFTWGNKLFAIPLADSYSPNNSPRWSYGILKKSPLQKTEFASDFIEVNSQNEVDDAILDNMNRQVHLDLKSLMALYMELDEERNASAVAANNAMAMITRLQEEKAALQMDALQYQRMMEEQVGYDEEALQASNDMILKLEEEVKALEAELVIYKAKYGCLTEDDFKETHSSHGADNTLLRLNEGMDNGEKDFNCHQAMSYQADNGGVKLNESLKDFKMEKTYLLGRMKKMENRTPLAENGIYSKYITDNVNGVYSGGD